MSETDKELLIKVELPGMTEKDLDISITGDLLTISGEKKQEKEETEKGWYRMERQYGSFSRSIPLPYEIDRDKAEALYKHGVLTVKLPKSAAQQKSAKSIAVKSV
ncbi:MAG: Hsp20/alpha crystallin family protein [Cyanobacteria bacterium]|nr:Hsp20/alpha crystallin family protein [Cyanobacteriota bacterium]